MIELHYWPTPNGWKVSIMLEEVGLPYRIVPVNIGRGDQFKPEFLAISPNNRMPAIVDHDPPVGPGVGPEAGGAPVAIFESGAILLYLAEKTGRLMPTDLRGRYDVMQWLMWQMGGLGPMLGQLGHFMHYAPEKLPYAIDRYTREVQRLYGVMDRRLADRDYLAGDYSVADIAAWSWASCFENYQLSLEAYPHVRRWHDAIKARPAVQRGRSAGEDLRQATGLDDEARRHLFGHPK